MPGMRRESKTRRWPARPFAPSLVAAATAATAAGVAAAAGALALRRWRRRKSYHNSSRPQARFTTVYADNTDRPFPHLPPQPCGAGGAAGHAADAGTAETGVGARHGSSSSPAVPGASASVSAPAAPAAVAATTTLAGVGQVHPYLPSIQRLMAATSCPVARQPLLPPAALPAALELCPQRRPWALPLPVPGRREPGPRGPGAGGPRVHWVDTPQQLQQLGQRLRRERQIGLDTEAHSLYSYHGMVCLLQLSAWSGGRSSSSNGNSSSCATSGTGSGSRAGSSTGPSAADPAGSRGRNAAHNVEAGAEAGVEAGVEAGPEVEVWLVDTLALHDHVGPALGQLMADPRVTKVVHGGGNDVMWLQRDFRLYLVNVFDTEKACQVLGYESRALSALLQRHCGLDVTAADKAAGQRADWRRRPLPPPLLRYAAADVAYLPYLADVLRRELAAAAASPAASIAAPTERCGSGTIDGIDSDDYALAPLVALQPLQPSQSPQAPQPAGGGGNGAGGDAAATASASRPVPTPLGQAVLRSHQVSLSLYRKPLSDGAAAAAAAVAGAAGGGDNQTTASAPLAAGTGSAAAAAVLRKFFSSSSAAAIPRATAADAASGAAGSGGALAEATEPSRPSVPSPPPLAAPQAADAVYALCRWRDGAARRLDVSPQAVMPDAAVAALAGMRPPPRDAAALVRLVGERVAAVNEALEAEPYAARYELCPAVRRDAQQLCALLAAAAAGMLPWAGPGAGAGGDAAAAGVRRPRHDPGAAQERRSWLIEKFSAKSQVYQNCRMLSREGGLLCYCDTRKLSWYLARGLAVQVCEDPPTIQLLFEHQNTDQQMGADDFYTQSKANRCVGCGCASHYLRYRVLPACYRRPMPPALKSHRSHDVVLLCIDCHERAQKAAERLKRQVAVDYGVPLLPPRTPPTAQTTQAAAAGGAVPAAAVSGAGTGGSDAYAGNNRDEDAHSYGGEAGEDGNDEDDGAGASTASRNGAAGGSGAVLDDAEGVLPGGIHPSAARRAALALQKNGAKMPLPRIRQLEATIKAALGRDPATEEPGLRPGDLEAALLAGLGRRGRNRYYRSQQEHQHHHSQQASGAATADDDDHGQDHEDPPAASPGASAAAAATAAALAVAGVGSVDRWLDSGHSWHGERVVRLAMERGGEEELLRLVKRFRACFVDAVRPQYLPPAWGVDHSARRDFGPYSVYAAERRQRELEEEGQEQERRDPNLGLEGARQDQ